MIVMNRPMLETKYSSAMKKPPEQDPDDISKNFHVLSCFIMIFQRYDKECNLGTGEKGTCNLL